MIDRKALSLFDLNRMIREVLQKGFPSTVWIIAEISEINENRSGHCYLELVEKNLQDDSIKAVCRATIWASRYRMIKPYFETTTGQALDAGIKVMVSVKVEFHERYGFSLNILDIEPSFTLGEIARKRMEILQKLEDDGVISMNQDLEMTLVPQKIAIISSETAAGYGDFIDQLNNNQSGYKFYTRLYPATMQGSETGLSIIHALDSIADHEQFFDLVVIIRGGGAKTDLSSFDNYDLGYYITQFPLPIISGIGHERDESVVDLVAHKSCKTPTAVAEFIIQQADYFISDMDNLRQEIVESSRSKLLSWKNQLTTTLHTMKQAGDNLISEEWMSLREKAIRGSSSTGQYIQQHQIGLKTQGLKFQTSAKHFLSLNKIAITEDLNNHRHAVKNLLREENNRLSMLGKEADLQDPARILKKGYSITFYNGQVLKNSKNISPGEKITTKLYSGDLSSKVISKKHN